MTDAFTPSIYAWLAAPLSGEVTAAIERLQRSPDVRHVAVMPDVHLANDVCVGVVMATERLIYPQAVGGDIGCGMLAVAFDSEAAPLDDPRLAGSILKDLGEAVPARRRNRRAIVEQPPNVAQAPLSHPALEAVHRNDGALEFATLGSGNHFLELQADEEGRLWLMVYSGSRALGQAIRDHHMTHAQPTDTRLRFLDAVSEAGQAYLHERDHREALCRRLPPGDGRASQRAAHPPSRQGRAVGNPAHDRSQPRSTGNPRRTRALGPPQRRDAGCAGRKRRPAGFHGQCELPRRRSRLRAGAML